MKTLTRFCCVITLLTSQSILHADGLYKWIDARGNTQYGDKPPAGVKAKSVDLPKITVIENYGEQWKPMNFKEPSTDNQKPIEQSQSVSSSYSKLSFLAPKANQAIRANDGDVSAMISIKPPLKKGHKLVFSIDGKTTGKGTSRTQNFSDLQRGSHTIGVKVIDEKGKTLKSSSVGFNVLRVSSLSNTQSNQATKLRQTRSFNSVRQQQIQNSN